MKKLLLLLAIAAMVGNKSQAQSFTMQADTVYFTLSGSGIDAISDTVAPAAASVTLHWHVIDSNFPTSWIAASGICDNNLCYNMNSLWTSGALKTSYPYTASGIHDYHLQVDNNTITGHGCYYVTARLKDYATNDSADVTFMICRSATSVQQVAGPLANVELYPNPATDAASMSFNLAKNTSVALSVFDAAGRQVYSRTATQMQSGINYVRIPTGNLPTGVYYVILNADGNKVTQKLSVIK